MTSSNGTLALVGGCELSEASEALDRELIQRANDSAAVLLPTAAAYEEPDAVAATAEARLVALGVSVHVCRVLRRDDAESEEHVTSVRDASLVYLVDGSPLHLRSVLKDSELFAALTEAWREGAVVAASGAGATLLCDPMVDPRGGAYTVGLGWVRNLAVFPYHGTAAEHLKQRSIDLLPDEALLAGVDEATALIRDPDGTWHASGAGAVALYAHHGEIGRYRNEPVPDLTGR